MTGYITLDAFDLVIAASLVLLSGGLSVVLQLGIERQLAVAAARMVVQLLLVGLVLKAIFAAGSLWLTLGAAAVMVLVAGREVRARQERPIAGLWGYGLGSITMLVAGGLITLFALTTQIQADPWYTPRYLLPLFGMILGNCMTGIALGLETLTQSALRERAAIEAQLLLGASRFEALKPVSRRALRSGFMPIINAMAATGIVALPGMMTGQILAGADPAEAVKYQLLIMFLIGGATGLGVLAAVLGAVWRLTDARDRLRLDRLTAAK